jgi:GT2 family glycosyltransferase
LGNTGGLMMIRKFVFEKCGMFNENYISCLEDVELNLKSIILGLELWELEKRNHQLLKK